MDLFILQSENYKKILAIALMVSIAFSLIPTKQAKAIPVKETFDWIFQILGNFFDQFVDQLYHMVVEMVKQRFIGVMINQTLTWVAGGGKPKFITNWKNFVKDAAVAVKKQTLANIKKFASTCLNFKAQFNFLLDLQYKMGDLQGLKCPAPILNAKGFFQNFNVGGWTGYMQSALPSGNFYGNMGMASNFVEGEAAAAADAQQNEGVSGKGFASAKKCVTTAEGQKCDEIKTPGATIDSMTSDALASPKDFLVNSGAKNLASLMAMLILSTLGKVITKGLDSK